MKIIGIILLSLIVIFAEFYFYIKYKSSNIKDNKDLEATIDKQVN